MPTTAHNQVLQRELPIVLQAQWQVHGVMQTLSSEVDGVVKPTLVVGAKRRQKVRSFPTLVMTASMVEPGREAGTMSNVTIDELEGLEVVFKLKNRCTASTSTATLEYRARLNDSRARYELTEAQMRDVIFKAGGTLDAKSLDARVNENLLDFEVEIPAKSLAVESSSRVIVQTRRVVVFVPGLLGSTIAVDTKSPEGPVQIYPNIYRSKRRISALRAAAERLVDPADLMGRVVEGIEHRHIEILECDAAGKPLLASDVELFQLGGELKGVRWNKLLGPGVVYDIKDRLETQWQAHIRDTNLPRDFMPIALVAWPYDWRLDLEDSAQQLFKTLTQLHQALLHDEDSDDLVTLAGHSTGGVIDRRVCGMDGIAQMVEHCFFMNAPFRGAPKATSVMLFGGSPPVQHEYDTMMPTPLISAAAMMRVAVNLPILYYLSPNFRYPDCVSSLSWPLCQRTGLMPAPDLGEHAREVEKRNAILAAVATGIYQPTRSVPASATETERVQLALGATEWHETWWDDCRRKTYEATVATMFREPPRPSRLKSNPNLALQDKLRAPLAVAWNETVAANAMAFHRLSETEIGASAVDLYVFWSEGHKTPGSVDFDLDGPEEDLDLHDYQGTLALLGEPPIGPDFDFRFQWLHKQARRQWVKVSGQIVDGDGTVPHASLLGIGTPNAKIFKPIPGNPAHVPAPNDAWVWDRVLDVLTERSVQGHLLPAATAEPKNRAPLPKAESGTARTPAR